MPALFLYGGILGVIMFLLGLLLKRWISFGVYIPQLLATVFVGFAIFEARLDNTGWAGLGAIILLVMLVIGTLFSIILHLALKYYNKRN
jgi:hypothetical protein